MNKIKIAKKQSIDGVLFLQGVFKSDCGRIEDFFHDRLLHGNDKPKKIYDKLPIIFTGLGSWPTHTNLLCWNCTLPVLARPWFEPQSINPVSKGNVGDYIDSSKLDKSGIIKNDYKINVKGCFCTHNCVMRYIMNYSKSMSERIDKKFMLLFLYEIMTGIKISNIDPAPHHTELLQYGGDKTEAEFRKKIDDINNVHSKRENEIFVSNCKTYLNNLID
jgi:hypothetical protein